MATRRCAPIITRRCCKMADIHAASTKASHAARHLAMAAAREIDGKTPDVWLALGVASLTEAANALGYVMVRTSATQPAAEPEAV